MMTFFYLSFFFKEKKQMPSIAMEMNDLFEKFNSKYKDLYLNSNNMVKGI